jgi:hypothetical protein
MNTRRRLVIAIAAALGIGLAAGAVNAGGWGYGPGGRGVCMGGAGYPARVAGPMYYRHLHRYFRAGAPVAIDTAATAPQLGGPGTGWRAQAGLCPRAQPQPQASGDVSGQSPPAAGPAGWRPRNGTGPRAQAGLCPYAQTQLVAPED